MLPALAGMAAVLAFSLACLLPRADATSVQAGLTVIAEILGVLLGAMLLVAVVLMEQQAQAEELLRVAQHKYRALINNELHWVIVAQRELTDEIKKGNLQLKQPVYTGPSGIPSRLTFKDAFEALTTLICLFPGRLGSHGQAALENQLTSLGYSRDDVIQVMYVRTSPAITEAESFLRLVDDALNMACIPVWASDRPVSLAAKVFQEYGREGVDDAFRRLDRSRAVLSSKIFAASLLLPILTTTLSVLSVFGITDRTVYVSPYGSVVVLVVVGFVASVAAALLVVERMLP